MGANIFRCLRGVFLRQAPVQQHNTRLNTGNSYPRGFPLLSLSYPTVFAVGATYLGGPGRFVHRPIPFSVKRADVAFVCCLRIFGHAFLAGTLKLLTHGCLEAKRFALLYDVLKARDSLRSVGVACRFCGARANSTIPPFRTRRKTYPLGRYCQVAYQIDSFFLRLWRISPGAPPTRKRRRRGSDKALS